MSRYTYIVLIDVSYYDNGTLFKVNHQRMHESFEKTMRFIQRCSYHYTLENSVIVYANNWGKTQEDIDVIKNEIRIYNQSLTPKRRLHFEECYHLEDFKKITEKFPPRKIFLTGGNLTGCMINESLPLTYHSIKSVYDNVAIVPELCFDTKDDIYRTWELYNRTDIDIETLINLEYYLFEQSIRNAGFFYTRFDNDYEIYVKSKELFIKRGQRSNPKPKSE